MRKARHRSGLFLWKSSRPVREIGWPPTANLPTAASDPAQAERMRSLTLSCLAQKLRLPHPGRAWFWAREEWGRQPPPAACQPLTNVVKSVNIANCGKQRTLQTVHPEKQTDFSQLHQFQCIAKRPGTLRYCIQRITRPNSFSLNARGDNQSYPPREVDRNQADTLPPPRWGVEAHQGPSSDRQS